jgi:hypothetical protein
MLGEGVGTLCFKGGCGCTEFKEKKARVKHMKKFWMVKRFGDNCHSCKKQYDSVTEAGREAERLAGLHPGEKFVVMGAEDYVESKLEFEWGDFER